MSASIFLGYVSVMVFSLFAALGAAFMKIYSKSNKKRDLVLFVLFYVFNILIMLLTLKYFELVLVFNLSSVVYIFSLILGRLIFKEEITKNKLIGLFLILIGTILVGM